MDISFFENLAKEGVEVIVSHDKTFYLRKPSNLNSLFVEIMTDDKLKTADKMLNALALVLCDQSGKLIFDINNEDHLTLIANIGDDYLIDIIAKMQEMMFPTKKK
jgi:hypothetical protein